VRPYYRRAHPHADPRNRLAHDNLANDNLANDDGTDDFDRK
jgi:hypothetical protein